MTGGEQGVRDPNATQQQHSGTSTEEPDGTDGYRVIGHDEFDPIGTLVLIGIYFLILSLLWLFMYFVEFLGNDPTVIGWAVTTIGLGVIL